MWIPRFSRRRILPSQSIVFIVLIPWFNNWWISIYLSTVSYRMGQVKTRRLTYLATTCISQSIFRRRSISDIKYSSDIDTMCNSLFSSTKLDYQRYVDKVGVLEATSLVLHKVYLLLVTTCKQAHWARQAPLLAETGAAIRIRRTETSYKTNLQQPPIAEPWGQISGESHPLMPAVLHAGRQRRHIISIRRMPEW